MTVKIVVPTLGSLVATESGGGGGGMVGLCNGARVEAERIGDETAGRLENGFAEEMAICAKRSGSPKRPRKLAGKLMEARTCVSLLCKSGDHARSVNIVQFLARQ